MRGRPDEVSRSVTRREFLQRAAVVAAVPSALGAAASPARAAASEQRDQARAKVSCQKAIWIGSRLGGDPDGTGRELDRLGAAGFKLLLPLVKGSQSVDFRTNVGTVNPEYPAWDPLAVLLKEASARSMVVHPWFVVFDEETGSPLLATHPQYAAVFDRGSGWACACQPGVQEYELALCQSVLENYPVRGVHLDYIRTGGWCRCAYCTEEMKHRGVDIHAVRPHEGGPGRMAWGEGHAAWGEWRAGRVTDFVTRLHASLQPKKVEISAAVFPEYPGCMLDEGQDWVAWADQGILEYIFPTTYVDSTREARMRARCHRALVGPRPQLWEGLGKSSSHSELSTRTMLDEAKACVEEGSQGIVFFSHSALTDEDVSALSTL